MWFLQENVAAEFAKFRRDALITSEAQAKFVERESEDASCGPRSLNVAGDVAEITVSGVLTERPDIIAWLFGFGNTTYSDIREALATADQDDKVKRIVLNVSSPGGHVHGLFETLAAVHAVSKPIAVYASQATSAAYAIAAVAGPITAATRVSEFGSIGIAVSLLTSEDVVDITSTDAPKKRPDPSTEEGRAVIRELLDALHGEFVAEIAKGRGTNAKSVNEEYGQGAVLLATEAKSRGMIDKVPGARGASSRRRAVAATEEVVSEPAEQDEPETQSPDQPAPAAGGAKQENRKMDLETFKKEHPAVYAAAVAEGEAKGRESERKRCLAHVKLAKSTGARDIADKAIESGASTMDEEVHAEYLSASLKSRDLDARRGDDATSAAALSGASERPGAGGSDTSAGQDLGDQVVAILERRKKGAA